MPVKPAPLSFDALRIPDGAPGSDCAAVSCWSDGGVQETELRAIANELSFFGLFLVCGGAGDVDFDLIEAAISLTDHTRAETPGGPPAAIDALDKSFQSLRGTLLKMSASDPLRGRAAREEIVAGLALINTILTASTAAWSADKNKLSQLPPTEVAGYITIAWSQLHWGFLNDPAYIRQNTVRGARAASVCVRWPLSDAAATLLSCAQAQVLRQHIHTRVAGFIEHVSA